MEFAESAAVQRIRRLAAHALGALRLRCPDRTLILVAGVVTALIGMLVGVAVVSIAGVPGASPPPPAPAVFDRAPTTTTSIAQILVHAAGAVRQPGLHRLATGSRVADLIEAAGGVDGSIDLDRVNLAAPVVDGERVYLPRLGEPVPSPAQPTTGTGDPGRGDGPIDLNTATQDQLEGLPGVGPATAASIVAERRTRGRFTSVEDLLDVRGIGTAKLDQLRDLVTVR